MRQLALQQVHHGVRSQLEPIGAARYAGIQKPQLTRVVPMSPAEAVSPPLLPACVNADALVQATRHAARMRASLVIDTNWLLDLWGFCNPLSRDLGALFLSNEPPDWIATAAMRRELLAVLSRPHLQAAFQARGGSHERVLQAFDAWARIVDAPPPQPLVRPIRCTDADDQKFIDLALHCGRVVLLSKDRAVLKLKNRLHQRGVIATPSWPPCVGFASA